MNQNQRRPIRLQKLIAESTELSRRAAEKSIEAGEVKVNGKVVTKLGTKVVPGFDHVTIRDRPIRQTFKKIYIAYNKVANTIVSKSDPEGRPTIWDERLKGFKRELNSAGRLDYSSEGLLILTNDGELINSLTHPRHEIWKVYEVKVKGIPTQADLSKMEKGMKIEGVDYLPSKAKILRGTEKNTWIQVQIREGKNRQVRKMCDAIGYPVLKLRRLAIGPITLKGIPQGGWRHLNNWEIERLKQETICGR